jgi:hypothetical protein
MVNDKPTVATKAEGTAMVFLLRGRRRILQVCGVCWHGVMANEFSSASSGKDRRSQQGGD